MALVFVAQGVAIVVGLTWLSIMMYLLGRPDVGFGYRVVTVMFWAALPAIFLIFVSARAGRRRARIERLRRKAARRA